MTAQGQVREEEVEREPREKRLSERHNPSNSVNLTEARNAGGGNEDVRGRGVGKTEEIQAEGRGGGRAGGGSYLSAPLHLSQQRCLTNKVAP